MQDFLKGFVYGGLMGLGLFLVILAAEYASANETCDFPQTKQTFPDTVSTGISKVQFDHAIDLVINRFGPTVRARGGNFYVDRRWYDETVNADAHREGNDWGVSMYGGLARYPGMTLRAFLGVVCHETGHHLGGRPRYGQNTDWASVEGQADYWAERCLQSRGINSDIPGDTLTGILARLGGERKPSVLTPDRTQVWQTFEEHPHAQCRFDTYRASRRKLARPRCWYKP